MAAVSQIVLSTRREEIAAADRAVGPRTLMPSRIDALKLLIDNLSTAERQEFANWYLTWAPRHPLELRWGVTADVVLNAIDRASDLSQRGIRGLIAEAIFETTVVPVVEGWRVQPVVSDAHDFEFVAGENRVRVQVKLQRLERQKPKLAPRPYPPGMFVVEVQRTRSGKRAGKKTRPYSFGDFDILAVNMHPSSGNWEDFVFTLARWLVPRPKERQLIAVLQPVPPQPNGYWTRDINECLEWYRSGREGQIFTPQPKQVRRKRPK